MQSSKAISRFIHPLMNNVNSFSKTFLTQQLPIASILSHHDDTYFKISSHSYASSALTYHPSSNHAFPSSDNFNIGEAMDFKLDAEAITNIAAMADSIAISSAAADRWPLIAGLQHTLDWMHVSTHLPW